MKNCYIQNKGNNYRALRYNPEKKHYFLNVPVNSCIVRERPKGHKKHYWYLYYRVGKRLRKEYINFLGEEGIRHVKWVIAEMKRRNAKNKEDLARVEAIYKFKGCL